MKKLLLGMVAACAVLGAKFTYTFDPNELFNDIEYMINNFLNPDTGILTAISNISADGQKLLAFSACSKLTAEQRKTVVIKNKAGKPIVGCADIKTPLNVISSVLDLLENKLVGEKSKPGLVTFILNLLDNAGVNNLEKVKLVVDDISNILENIGKLLNVLEKYMVVDNSGQVNKQA